MCTCISRVLVSKKIEQELTASLKNALGSVKIGHGLDPSTNLGPLIDMENQKRAIGLIELGSAYLF